jgi:magnesium chelatase subunit I
MGIAYPVSAIVGQEELKRALLLAAVDPSIGGVLALGDRGTGKSTTVRALADLLPERRVAPGDPYGRTPEEWSAANPGLPVPKAVKSSIPVVDLPLGVTEDRVVGALDLEKALTKGEKAFEPGLLARAHGGFLYIDEVNLLEDHIVDLLLDVAASGENVVEREGLSLRHPARFVLIGSGNPEEGELRPQLLDRFGLSVDVRTPQDVPTRIEVIRRRDAFDRDPVAFTEAWALKTTKIRRSILAGRKKLASVEVDDSLLEKATRLCLALGTDGLRGELTLLRASRAYAALEGRSEAGVKELRVVASSALRHRLRRDPLDDIGSGARVERAIAEALGA